MPNREVQFVDMFVDSVVGATFVGAPIANAKVPPRQRSRSDSVRLVRFDSVDSVRLVWFDSVTSVRFGYLDSIRFELRLTLFNHL